MPHWAGQVRRPHSTQWQMERQFRPYGFGASEHPALSSLQTGCPVRDRKHLGRRQVLDRLFQGRHPLFLDGCGLETLPLTPILKANLCASLNPSTNLKDRVIKQSQICIFIPNSFPKPQTPLSDRQEISTLISHQDLKFNMSQNET